MRAVRRFTVRASLPDSLSGLGALATNLRWTWHPPTRDLFASMDAELFNRIRDPLRMLTALPAARLAELAVDEEFLERARVLAADLDRYISEPRWYQRKAANRPEQPDAVAYFSMEFGVTEALPNYSGGLGVLAGDHLKAASDLGVPLIGVGLLYHAGYFKQSLSREGWQLEQYPVLDPDELPISEYDALNVSEAVSAIKELTTPSDVRAVLAYEEAHKNRHSVVSAAQTRVAAIAQEVVGIS